MAEKKFKSSTQSLGNLISKKLQSDHHRNNNENDDAFYLPTENVNKISTSSTSILQTTDIINGNHLELQTLFEPKEVITVTPIEEQSPLNFDNILELPSSSVNDEDFTKHVTDNYHVSLSEKSTFEHKEQLNNEILTTVPVELLSVVEETDNLSENISTLSSSNNENGNIEKSDEFGVLETISIDQDLEESAKTTAFQLTSTSSTTLSLHNQIALKLLFKKLKLGTSTNNENDDIHYLPTENVTNQVSTTKTNSYDAEISTESSSTSTFLDVKLLQTDLKSSTVTDSVTNTETLTGGLNSETNNYEKNTNVVTDHPTNDVTMTVISESNLNALNFTDSELATWPELTSKNLDESMPKLSSVTDELLGGLSSKVLLDDNKVITNPGLELTATSMEDNKESQNLQNILITTNKLHEETQIKENSNGEEVISNELLTGSELTSSTLANKHGNFPIQIINKTFFNITSKVKNVTHIFKNFDELLHYLKLKGFTDENMIPIQPVLATDEDLLLKILKTTRYPFINNEFKKTTDENMILQELEKTTVSNFEENTESSTVSTLIPLDEKEKLENISMTNNNLLERTQLIKSTNEDVVSEELELKTFQTNIDENKELLTSNELLTSSEFTTIGDKDETAITLATISKEHDNVLTQIIGKTSKVTGGVEKTTRYKFNKFGFKKTTNEDMVSSEPVLGPEVESLTQVLKITHNPFIGNKLKVTTDKNIILQGPEKTIVTNFEEKESSTTSEHVSQITTATETSSNLITATVKLPEETQFQESTNKNTETELAAVTTKNENENKVWPDLTTTVEIAPHILTKTTIGLFNEFQFEDTTNNEDMTSIEPHSSIRLTNSPQILKTTKNLFVVNQLSETTNESMLSKEAELTTTMEETTSNLLVTDQNLKTNEGSSAENFEHIATDQTHFKENTDLISKKFKLTKGTTHAEENMNAAAKFKGEYTNTMEVLPYISKTTSSLLKNFLVKGTTDEDMLLQGPQKLIVTSFNENKELSSESEHGLQTTTAESTPNIIATTKQSEENQVWSDLTTTVKIVSHLSTETTKNVFQELQLEETTINEDLAPIESHSTTTLTNLPHVLKTTLKLFEVTTNEDLLSKETELTTLSTTIEENNELLTTNVPVTAQNVATSEGKETSNTLDIFLKESQLPSIVTNVAGNKESSEILNELLTLSEKPTHSENPEGISATTELTQDNHFTESSNIDLISKVPEITEIATRTEKTINTEDESIITSQASEHFSETTYNIFKIFESKETTDEDMAVNELYLSTVVSILPRISKITSNGFLENDLKQTTKNEAMGSVGFEVITSTISTVENESSNNIKDKTEALPTLSSDIPNISNIVTEPHEIIAQNEFKSKSSEKVSDLTSSNNIIWNAHTIGLGTLVESLPHSPTTYTDLVSSEFIDSAETLEPNNDNLSKISHNIDFSSTYFDKTSVHLTSHMPSNDETILTSNTENTMESSNLNKEQSPSSNYETNSESPLLSSNPFQEHKQSSIDFEEITTKSYGNENGDWVTWPEINSTSEKNTISTLITKLTISDLLTTENSNTNEVTEIFQNVIAFSTTAKESSNETSPTLPDELQLNFNEATIEHSTNLSQLTIENSLESHIPLIVNSTLTMETSHELLTGANTKESSDLFKDQSTFPNYEMKSKSSFFSSSNHSQAKNETFIDFKESTTKSYGNENGDWVTWPELNSTNDKNTVSTLLTKFTISDLVNTENSKSNDVTEIFQDSLALSTTSEERSSETSPTLPNKFDVNQTPIKDSTNLPQITSKNNFESTETTLSINSFSTTESYHLKDIANHILTNYMSQIEIENTLHAFNTKDQFNGSDHLLHKPKFEKTTATDIMNIKSSDQIATQFKSESRSTDLGMNTKLNIGVTLEITSSSEHTLTLPDEIESDVNLTSEQQESSTVTTINPLLSLTEGNINKNNQTEITNIFSTLSEDSDQAKSEAMTTKAFENTKSVEEFSSITINQNNFNNISQQIIDDSKASTSSLYNGGTSIPVDQYGLNSKVQQNMSDLLHNQSATEQQALSTSLGDLLISNSIETTKLSITSENNNIKSTHSDYRPISTLETFLVPVSKNYHTEAHDTNIVHKPSEVTDISTSILFKPTHVENLSHSEHLITESDNTLTFMISNEITQSNQVSIGSTLANQNYQAEQHDTNLMHNLDETSETHTSTLIQSTENSVSLNHDQTLQTELGHKLTSIEENTQSNNDLISATTNLFNLTPSHINDFTNSDNSVKNSVAESANTDLNLISFSTEAFLATTLSTPSSDSKITENDFNTVLHEKVLEHTENSNNPIVEVIPHLEVLDEELMHFSTLGTHITTISTFDGTTPVIGDELLISHTENKFLNSEESLAKQSEILHNSHTTLGLDQGMISNEIIHSMNTENETLTTINTHPEFSESIHTVTIPEYTQTHLMNVENQPLTTVNTYLKYSESGHSTFSTELEISPNELTHSANTDNQPLTTVNTPSEFSESSHVTVMKEHVGSTNELTHSLNTEYQPYTTVNTIPDYSESSHTTFSSEHGITTNELTPLVNTEYQSLTTVNEHPEFSESSHTTLSLEHGISLNELTHSVNIENQPVITQHTIPEVSESSHITFSPEHGIPPNELTHLVKTEYQPLTTTNEHPEFSESSHTTLTSLDNGISLNELAHSTNTEYQSVITQHTIPDISESSHTTFSSEHGISPSELTSSVKTEFSESSHTTVMKEHVGSTNELIHSLNTEYQPYTTVNTIPDYSESSHTTFSSEHGITTNELTPSVNTEYQSLTTVNEHTESSESIHTTLSLEHGISLNDLTHSTSTENQPVTTPDIIPEVSESTHTIFSSEHGISSNELTHSVNTEYQPLTTVNEHLEFSESSHTTLSLDHGISLHELNYSENTENQRVTTTHTIPEVSESSSTTFSLEHEISHNELTHSLNTEYQRPTTLNENVEFSESSHTTLSLDHGISLNELTHSTNTENQPVITQHTISEVSESSHTTFSPEHGIPSHELTHSVNTEYQPLTTTNEHSEFSESSHTTLTSLENGILLNELNHSTNAEYQPVITEHTIPEVSKSSHATFSPEHGISFNKLTHSTNTEYQPVITQHTIPEVSESSHTTFSREHGIPPNEMTHSVNTEYQPLTTTNEHTEFSESDHTALGLEHGISVNDVTHSADTENQPVTPSHTIPEISESSHTTFSPEHGIPPHELTHSVNTEYQPLTTTNEHPEFSESSHTTLTSLENGILLNELNHSTNAEYQPVITEHTIPEVSKSSHATFSPEHGISFNKLTHSTNTEYQPVITQHTIPEVSESSHTTFSREHGIPPNEMTHSVNTEYQPLTTTNEHTEFSESDHTALGLEHGISVNDVTHSADTENQPVTPSHTIPEISESSHTTFSPEHGIPPHELTHSVNTEYQPLTTTNEHTEFSESDHTALGLEHGISVNDVTHSADTENQPVTPSHTIPEISESSHTTFSPEHGIPPHELTHSVNTDYQPLTTVNEHTEFSESIHTTLNLEHGISLNDLTHSTDTENQPVTTPLTIPEVSEISHTTFSPEHGILPNVLTHSVNTEYQPPTTLNKNLEFSESSHTTLSLDHGISFNELTQSTNTENQPAITQHTISEVSENSRTTFNPEHGISPNELTHSVNTEYQPLTTVNERTEFSESDHSAVSLDHGISPNDLTHSTNTENQPVTTPHIISDVNTEYQPPTTINEHTEFSESDHTTLSLEHGISPNDLTHSTNTEDQPVTTSHIISEVSESSHTIFSPEHGISPNVLTHSVNTEYQRPTTLNENLEFSESSHTTLSSVDNGISLNELTHSVNTEYEPVITQHTILEVSESSHTTFNPEHGISPNVLTHSVNTEYQRPITLNENLEFSESSHTTLSLEHGIAINELTHLANTEGQPLTTVNLESGLYHNTTIDNNLSHLLNSETQSLPSVNTDLQISDNIHINLTTITISSLSSIDNKQYIHATLPAELEISDNEISQLSNTSTEYLSSGNTEPHISDNLHSTLTNPTSITFLSSSITDFSQNIHRTHVTNPEISINEISHIPYSSIEHFSNTNTEQQVSDNAHISFNNPTFISVSTSSLTDISQNLYINPSTNLYISNQERTHLLNTATQFSSTETTEHQIANNLHTSFGTSPIIIHSSASNEITHNIHTTSHEDLGVTSSELPHLINTPTQIMSTETTEHQITDNFHSGFSSTSMFIEGTASNDIKQNIHSTSHIDLGVTINELPHLRDTATPLLSTETAEHENADILHTSFGSIPIHGSTSNGTTQSIYITSHADLGISSNELPHLPHIPTQLSSNENIEHYTSDNMHISPETPTSFIFHSTEIEPVLTNVDQDVLKPSEFTIFEDITKHSETNQIDHTTDVPKVEILDEELIQLHSKTLTENTTYHTEHSILPEISHNLHTSSHANLSITSSELPHLLNTATQLLLTETTEHEITDILHTSFGSIPIHGSTSNGTTQSIYITSHADLGISSNELPHLPHIPTQLSSNENIEHYTSDNMHISPETPTSFIFHSTEIEPVLTNVDQDVLKPSEFTIFEDITKHSETNQIDHTTDVPKVEILDEELIQLHSKTLTENTTYHTEHSILPEISHNLHTSSHANLSITSSELPHLLNTATQLLLTETTEHEITDILHTSFGSTTNIIYGSTSNHTAEGIHTSLHADLGLLSNESPHLPYTPTQLSSNENIEHHTSDNMHTSPIMSTTSTPHSTESVPVLSNADQEVLKSTEFTIFEDIAKHSETNEMNHTTAVPKLEILDEELVQLHSKTSTENTTNHHELSVISQSSQNIHTNSHADLGVTSSELSHLLNTAPQLLSTETIEHQIADNLHTSVGSTHRIIEGTASNDINQNIHINSHADMGATTNELPPLPSIATQLLSTETTEHQTLENLHTNFGTTFVNIHDLASNEVTQNIHTTFHADLGVISSELSNLLNTDTQLLSTETIEHQIADNLHTSVGSTHMIIEGTTSNVITQNIQTDSHASLGATTNALPYLLNTTTQLLSSETIQHEITDILHASFGSTTNIIHSLTSNHTAESISSHSDLDLSSNELSHLPYTSTQLSSNKNIEHHTSDNMHTSPITPSTFIFHSTESVPIHTNDDQEVLKSTEFTIFEDIAKHSETNEMDHTTAVPKLEILDEELVQLPIKILTKNTTDHTGLSVISESSQNVHTDSHEDLGIRSSELPHLLNTTTQFLTTESTEHQIEENSHINFGTTSVNIHGSASNEITQNIHTTSNADLSATSNELSHLQNTATQLVSNENTEHQIVDNLHTSVGSTHMIVEGTASNVITQNIHTNSHGDLGVTTNESLHLLNTATQLLSSDTAEHQIADNLETSFGSTPIVIHGSDSTDISQNIYTTSHTDLSLSSNELPHSLNTATQLSSNENTEHETLNNMHISSLTPTTFIFHSTESESVPTNTEQEILKSTEFTIFEDVVKHSETNQIDHTTGVPKLEILDEELIQLPNKLSSDHTIIENMHTTSLITLKTSGNELSYMSSTVTKPLTSQYIVPQTSNNILTGITIPSTLIVHSTDMEGNSNTDNNFTHLTEDLGINSDTVHSSHNTLISTLGITSNDLLNSENQHISDSHSSLVNPSTLIPSTGNESNLFNTDKEFYTSTEFSVYDDLTKHLETTQINHTTVVPKLEILDEEFIQIPNKSVQLTENTKQITNHTDLSTLPVTFSEFIPLPTITLFDKMFTDLINNNTLNNTKPEEEELTTEQLKSTVVEISNQNLNVSSEVSNENLLHTESFDINSTLRTNTNLITNSFSHNITDNEFLNTHSTLFEFQTLEDSQSTKSFKDNIISFHEWLGQPTVNGTDQTTLFFNVNESALVVNTNSDIEPLSTNDLKHFTTLTHSTVPYFPSITNEDSFHTSQQYLGTETNETTIFTINGVEEHQSYSNPENLNPNQQSLNQNHTLPSVITTSPLAYSQNYHNEDFTGNEEIPHVSVSQEIMSSEITTSLPQVRTTSTLAYSQNYHNEDFTGKEELPHVSVSQEMSSEIETLFPPVTTTSMLAYSQNYHNEDFSTNEELPHVSISQEIIPSGITTLFPPDKTISSLAYSHNYFPEDFSVNEEFPHVSISREIISSGTTTFSSLMTNTETSIAKSETSPNLSTTQTLAFYNKSRSTETHNLENFLKTDQTGNNKNDSGASSTEVSEIPTSRESTENFSKTQNETSGETLHSKNKNIDNNSSETSNLTINNLKTTGKEFENSSNEGMWEWPQLKQEDYTSNGNPLTGDHAKITQPDLTIANAKFEPADNEILFTSKPNLSTTALEHISMSPNLVTHVTHPKSQPEMNKNVPQLEVQTGQHNPMVGNTNLHQPNGKLQNAPIYINLPVYPVDSTYPLLLKFNEYYSSTAKYSIIIDDEATDRVINTEQFRSMKLEDFNAVTEFPSTTVKIEETEISKQSQTNQILSTTVQPTTALNTALRTDHIASNQQSVEVTTKSEESHIGKSQDNLHNVLNEYIHQNQQNAELTTKSEIMNQNVSNRVTENPTVGSSLGVTHIENTLGTSSNALNEVISSEEIHKTTESSVPNDHSQPVMIISEFPKFQEESTCNYTDYLSQNNCMCSMDNLIKDLRMKLVNNFLNFSIDNFTCPIFTHVEAGIFLGNDSVPQISKSRRDVVNDMYSIVVRRETVEYQNMDKTLNEQLELKNTENDIFATPGMKILIPCITSNNLSEGSTNYSWTFSDNLPLTEGKIQETEGTLTIDNVAPQDAGNYTCIATSSNANKSDEKRYEHHLSVVSIPSYRLQTTLLYNSTEKCQSGDADIISLYLPNSLEGLICGNYFKVCSIEVKNPKCLNATQYTSVNLTVIIEPINVIMPAINNSVCDVGCEMKIYTHVVLFIIKNLEAVLKLPVFFRLSYRQQKLMPTEVVIKKTRQKLGTEAPKLIITCPPGFGYYKRTHVCGTCGRNTFSRGDETFCSSCPAGQYQPMVGSKSCLICATPLQDPYCLRVMYSNTHKFRVLIGITTTVLVVLIILLLCLKSMRKSNNSRSNTKFGRESYLKNRRQSKRRMRDPDVEMQDSQPLLDSSRERKYKGYGRKPPEPPPPDFY